MVVFRFFISQDNLERFPEIASFQFTSPNIVIKVDIAVVRVQKVFFKVVIRY